MIGIIALLIAILLPPLQLARRQAVSTSCAAQLLQLGVALQTSKNETGFYPLWDDGGSPTRFTWIDVLIQRGYLPDRRVAYCPEDPAPSTLNAARAAHHGVTYPGGDAEPGIDYSYGIGAPLSSGAWQWRSSYAPPGDDRRRRFDGADRYTSQRILAADADWSVVYNVSGDATTGLDWSYPTQYDNTIAYRHPGRTANALYQDLHVSRIQYEVASTAAPVNTVHSFLWYPGEPVHVGPEHSFGDNYYPSVPAFDGEGAHSGGIPDEMVPAYYTHHLLWTHITHK